MPPCPIDLTVDTFAAMLNCELADHPVYDGLELQWFDDERHGTGLLAFLSRRDGRVVDYYVAPGLRLDPAGYRIGGGTGSWTETTFDVGRLEVHPDGVDAQARFTDVDGRAIEVVVRDRDGRPRRRGGLLAPVSSAIDDPTSLMLVWMPGFDLVRAGGRPPVIRIDGVDAAIGQLPGRRLHRRHLVKYAAPLITVHVGRAHDGPLAEVTPTATETSPAGVVALTATGGGAAARLAFVPALPDAGALADGTALADGERRDGAWTVEVAGARVTGGIWHAHRVGDATELGLDVTERWRPHRLPLLMRVVTRVVPVFRTWPTTYRWRARLAVGEGTGPRLTSGWERTDDGGAEAYRRATSSVSPPPTA